MSTRQRRHFEGTEKVAILKRHLIDKVTARAARFLRRPQAQPAMRICDASSATATVMAPWTAQPTSLSLAVSSEPA